MTAAFFSFPIENLAIELVQEGETVRVSQSGRY